MAGADDFLNASRGGATDALLKSLRGGASPAQPKLPTGGGSATDALLKSLQGDNGAKGGGGFFSHIPKPVTGLLGAVGSVLSAPQQALFKGVQAGNLAAHGQFGAAGKSGLNAVGEMGGLGGALGGLGGKDIDFAEAIGHYDPASGRVIPAKLPRGVNTGVGLVADPLNFLTFGSGSLAEQGAKIATKELGDQAVEQIAKQGLRKGLSEAEQVTLRRALAREATEAGAKNAEKTAAKQFEALATRGRGGLGVRIPGTGIGGAIIPGETLARAGEKSGLTAARDFVAGSRPVRVLGRALIPGRAVSEVVGPEAGREVLEAGARRSHTAASSAEDLFHRTKAALDDFAQHTGRVFTAEDDAFVHAALEAGPAARAAAKVERPELTRVIDSFDAMRKEMGRAQVERGLIQGAEAVPATRPTRTVRKVGTVKERLAEKADAAEVARLEQEAADAQRRADVAAQRASAKGESFARPGDKAPPQERGPHAPAATVTTSNAGELAARRKGLGDQIAGIRTAIGDAESGAERASLLEKLATAERRLAELPAAETYEKTLPAGVSAHRTPIKPGPVLPNVKQTELHATGEKIVAADKAVVDAAARKQALSEVRSEAARQPRRPRLKLSDLEVAKTAAAPARNEETYLHRVLTPEAQTAFRRQEQQTVRTGGSVSKALNQGAAKARTIAPEHTARTINDAIETLQKGGIVPDPVLHDSIKNIAQMLKPGEKLYKESAVTSLLDRNVEAAKAIATADYVKELRGITDDAGEKVMLSAADVAEAGGEVPGHFVKFDLPRLGTFYAPKAVKDELVGVVGRLDDVSGLTKALDSADRWWRSQVTASLPGGIPFATRNARSNVMLMWLSGTNVPKYMAEGAGLQRAVRRVLTGQAAEVADHGVEAAMKAHLTSRQFQLWDAARKNGIIGDAFYTVELGQAPKLGVKGAAKEGGLPRRAIRAVGGTEGTLATKGRQLNEAVEQHARLSQFLSDVDRLGNLDAAARRTKDVLFDYSALTPTERKIKRWVMPFYTWSRKNSPAQVRRFIEAPGRFVLPEKLAKATTSDLPEGSPEYQKRQGSRLSKVPGLVGMVTKPERPFPAAVSNFEPLYQLATGHGQEGLRGVASNIGGIPGAPAKALFEQATGKSVFTGYNLPKSAAERQKLALQTVLPSLSRAWPVSARLPSATAAQKKKLAANWLAELLTMAGVALQPVDAAAIKKQARIDAALKRAQQTK